MTITVIENILSDKSTTYDILLQDGAGGSVTIYTTAADIFQAERKANKLHDVLEEVTLGGHVDYAATLTIRGQG